MRLLYISPYHSTMEVNHLTLFSELGIDWFSTGIYKDPSNPYITSSSKWQDLHVPLNVDRNLIEEFNRLNPEHKMYSNINLTKEFVDKFDVVLCCFSFPVQGIIDSVWSSCNHKPFIYLTYSQQFSPFEEKLKRYKEKGVYLIRGSELESTIQNYAGHDAIIYCHVDENIYNSWVGGKPKVLTFANDYLARINHPNFHSYRAYKKLQPYIPFSFYGVQSEHGGGMGFITFEDKLKAYKQHDVYLALSSPPSTITYNFLEAWMTGIPVVTFGHKLGNGVGYETWQAPEFIDNGVNGYYSDDLNEVVQVCTDLLHDEDLRNQFSVEGRKTCLQLFGKEVVKKRWKTFFNKLGLSIGSV